MTGLRVAVIDDHAGFRSTLRRMLESEGWTVVGDAGDGASGLDVVARARPDVVLVDVGLPDIDGFDIAARLRAIDDAPIVLLISSREAATYAGRLADSAAHGFIAKHELDGNALRSAIGELRGWRA